MNQKKQHIWLLTLSVFLLVIVFACYLKTGYVQTTWSEVYNAFIHPSEDPTSTLVWSFRLPRILMAFIAGSALSVSGMMMQNVFKNPLAGPDILGISAGSSLFVAVWILTGFTFLGTQSDSVAVAIIGALAMGSFILLAALKLRSIVHLLLTGLMLASFISALISILQASAASERLQQFVFWNFGSLQKVSINEIPLIFMILLLAIALALFQVRNMNAMVLGEEAASALGVSIRRYRLWMILTSGILTGLITAFAGPIAFVGLAIPNLSKMVFKSQNHFTLFAANLFFGALFLGLCDWVIVGLEPYAIIPLNALTSIIGVPFVLWIILKNQHVTR